MDDLPLQRRDSDRSGYGPWSARGSRRVTLHFVAAGGGYGWVSDEPKGVVYKIDRRRRPVATYHTGEGARPDVLRRRRSLGRQPGRGHRVRDQRRYRRDPNASSSITQSHRRRRCRTASSSRRLPPGRTYEDRDRRAAGTGGEASRPAIPVGRQRSRPRLHLARLPGGVRHLREAAQSTPTSPARAGAQLQPEVAASMPTLSDRPADVHVHDPPRLPVLPALRPTGHGGDVSLLDRAGPLTQDGNRRGRRTGASATSPARPAYRAGNADHISGLKAHGDTLTITLVKPSPDFLQRLALPFFCPVPIGTPAGQEDAGATVTTASGKTTIPSAGPYYIADSNAGEYADPETKPQLHRAQTTRPGRDRAARRHRPRPSHRSESRADPGMGSSTSTIRCLTPAGKSPTSGARTARQPQPATSGTTPCPCPDCRGARVQRRPPTVLGRDRSTRGRARTRPLRPRHLDG